jgi:glycosyltransferase involved in cell wall biosynthesis
MTTLRVRLGIQQRMLPAYRGAFFDMLAAQCEHGLSVFAGKPRPSEAVGASAELRVATHVLANNLHISSGRTYLCWQLNLINWLNSWQPDVLIVEANPRYLSTPAAIRWMRRQRRPVLAWGLGVPGSEEPRGIIGRALQGWKRLFFKQFNILIAYSQQGAEEYAALGFPEDRIYTAVNAVAPRPTGEIPERPPEFGDPHPVVLYVGRLQLRKRIECLIKACAEISSAPKPTLWIVGDGPEKENLQKVAEAIYPDTYFWGALHGERLSDRFRTADLFVLPGTGGLAVQQAMSHGLPVIVAEADGTQSDLVDQRNGWLVRAGDQDNLTSALESALSDAPALRKKGEFSFQVARDRVNLESMTAVFSQAILQSLER